MLEGENLVLECRIWCFKAENLVLEGEKVEGYWQLVGFGSPATVTAAASWITRTLQTLIVRMSTSIMTMTIKIMMTMDKVNHNENEKDKGKSRGKGNDDGDERFAGFALRFISQHF